MFQDVEFWHVGHHFYSCLRLHKYQEKILHWNKMNMEKSTLRHVQIKVSYFRENNKVSKEEKQLLT